jgi:hypothetical protein
MKRTTRGLVKVVDGKQVATAMLPPVGAVK